MSPIHIKKPLLNGRTDSMETGSGANISPKKGQKHLLGRINMAAGFSEFTADNKSSSGSTPKSVDKKPSLLRDQEKKNSTLSPHKPKK